MAIGGNTGLIGLTGTLQQKSALSAWHKQTHGAEPLPRTAAADTHGLGTAEKQSQDITTLSRAGIAALENARAVGDETIIRGDDSAAEDLDAS